MADGDHVNRLDNERLWDRDGLEWTTKWARWATAKQVASFVRRDHPIAMSDGPGESPQWIEGEVAAEWWAYAKKHFEVPGRDSDVPDGSGPTWGAHIYRRGTARMLVVEEFC